MTIKNTFLFNSLSKKDVLLKMFQSKHWGQQNNRSIWKSRGFFVWIYGRWEKLSDSLALKFLRNLSANFIYWFVFPRSCCWHTLNLWIYSTRNVYDYHWVPGDFFLKLIVFKIVSIRMLFLLTTQLYRDTKNYVTRENP